MLPALPTSEALRTARNRGPALRRPRCRQRCARNWKSKRPGSEPFTWSSRQQTAGLFQTGTTIWRLQRLRVTKYPLADAPDLLRYKFIQWPYLEAAGIYAPGYGIEVERFSSLEPLVLHYLDQSNPIKVERVGVNLRVTFQVEDELARLQAMEMRKSSKDSSKTQDPDKQNSVKPTRKVVFLLDPKHGY